MSELTRPLTVRFASRQFSRLGHDEVLNGIEQLINISLVKAVQITETTCFITLKSREAKEQLIIDGLTVRDIHNNVFDVDKIVTNVTVKDAPYELSDAFLIQHLKSYGDVLEDSLKLVKLKIQILKQAHVMCSWLTAKKAYQLLRRSVVLELGCTLTIKPNVKYANTLDIRILGARIGTQ